MTKAQFKIQLSKLNTHLSTPQNLATCSQSYKEEKIPMLNSIIGGGFEDTEYMWLDIDVLQMYLNYIKSEMNRLQITAQGVRFTLGKYGTHLNGSLLPPDLQNKTTLFLSPMDMLEREENPNDLTVDTKARQALGRVSSLNYMNLCPPN